MLGCLAAGKKPEKASLILERLHVFFCFHTLDAKHWEVF